MLTLESNHDVLQLAAAPQPVPMSQPIPPSADPSLFWNGQYLLEEDPDDPENYSKAAEEAQRAVSVLRLHYRTYSVLTDTRSEMAETHG